MTVVTTTLNFGLVSVPVGLDKVAEANDITLDRASQNGNAIIRKELDRETGEVVESEDVQYGIYEDRKAKTGFRPVPKDALADIKAETKLDAFDIEAFIDLDTVPFERAIGCYLIKAQKGVSPKPLRILYDALTATGKAGVFKLTLRERQYPAVVYARNGGLYVNTMVWAEDFTRAENAAEHLAEVEVPADHLAMAKTLVENMSAGREVLDNLTDSLRPLKADLIEQALAGKKIKTTAKPKKAEPTDDLATKLAESIAAQGAKQSGKTSSRARRQKTPAAA